MFLYKNFKKKYFIPTQNDGQCRVFFYDIAVKKSFTMLFLNEMETMTCSYFESLSEQDHNTVLDHWSFKFTQSFLGFIHLKAHQITLSFPEADHSSGKIPIKRKK